jgi:hypothetical protein
MTTAKRLTKKQKKVIVASFIGQIIKQTDLNMFGNEPEAYIAESDQEEILRLIDIEANKYLAKAGNFSNFCDMKNLVLAAGGQSE